MWDRILAAEQEKDLSQIKSAIHVDWLRRSNAELTLPLQIVVAAATGRLLTSHLCKGPG